MPAGKLALIFLLKSAVLFDLIQAVDKKWIERERIKRNREQETLLKLVFQIAKSDGK